MASLPRLWAPSDCSDQWCGRSKALGLLGLVIEGLKSVRKAGYMQDYMGIFWIYG